jgi:hypothetical protein
MAVTGEPRLPPAPSIVAVDAGAARARRRCARRWPERDCSLSFLLRAVHAAASECVVIARHRHVGAGE